MERKRSRSRSRSQNGETNGATTGNERENERERRGKKTPWKTPRQGPLRSVSVREPGAPPFFGSARPRTAGAFDSDQERSGCPGQFTAEQLTGLIGLPRSLPQEALARAETLRRELPTRWTSMLLDLLVLENRIRQDQAPHRATLDRYLRRRGASRRQLHVLGENRTCKLSFPNFGDLWVGDYHHGPRVDSTTGLLDHQPQTRLHRRAERANTGAGALPLPGCGAEPRFGSGSAGLGWFHVCR